MENPEEQEQYIWLCPGKNTTTTSRAREIMIKGSIIKSLGVSISAVPVATCRKIAFTFF